MLYNYRKKQMVEKMIHIEIRKKIIEARAKGLKITEIRRAYGYSESAINRLLKLARETGDITPKTHMRGRKATLDSTGYEEMRELIKSKPDITLEEIKEEMQLELCITAISAIVRNKLGFRFKKRRYTLQSENELM
jgi:transposase